MHRIVSPHRPLLLALSALVGLTLPACSGDSAMTDAGDAARSEAGTDLGHDGGVMVYDSGPIRRPCTADSECADRVNCTVDSCGTDHFCRNTIDLTVCDDHLFCNGIEQCDLVRGCVAGPPEACNDMDVCTIDRCEESTRMCMHAPRDLDMDGDPDWHCAGGGDCNDLDPTISSHSPELCGDHIDNDCDGVIDEMLLPDGGTAVDGGRTDVGTCGAPAHDACDDPLDVSAGGTFALSTMGVTPDYTFGCVGSPYKDLALTFTLTSPKDVTIEADPTITVAEAVLETACGSATTPTKCNTGIPALVRARALPAGTYYVIVGTAPFTPAGDSLVVNVTFADPTTPPTNESCASPLDITGGGHFAGNFVGVTNDVSIPCNAGSNPDLVYSFTTTSPQDVVIRGTTPTSDTLNVCVRSTCAGGGEVRCTGGQPLTTTIHSLPAGTWYLVLEGPSYREVDYMLDVTFGAPTPSPPGDTCANPITLVPGTPATGSLGDKQDDIVTSCGYDYDDAVYTFTLPAAADVNLSVDAGTRYFDVSLRSTCDTSSSELRCVGGAPPAARVRALAAGTYYAVVEAPYGAAYTVSLTATSPPVVPTVVTGNETCAGAYTIPPTGGVFTGDTTTAIHDYDISMCTGMSHDVAYVMHLTASKNVTIHTDGSSFMPVVAIYRDSCAAVIYCSNDFGSGSAHDAVFGPRLFAPGDYYVVVSGFSSFSNGTYFLDVTIADP